MTNSSQTPTTKSENSTSDSEVSSQEKKPHVHGPNCNHGHHHHEEQTPFVRTSPKIGPNDPCTCGSGKKYKKCCRT